MKNEWKTMHLWVLLLFLLMAGGGRVWAAHSGTPFVVNYLPETYHAHSRCFDVIGDKYGRVYVANFEGLLYYDQAEWRIIHSPGVSRITRLYQDSDGRIWVGGYNLFGYLSATTNGELQLQMVFSKDNKGFLGEVIDISEKDGKIYVDTSIGNGYLEDDSMKDYVVRKAEPQMIHHYREMVINDSVRLNDGSVLKALQGGGLVRVDAKGKEIFQLTENNGLCNDNVNALFADPSGLVWGATDNGVFLVDILSLFTRFTASEGLLGEVQSIRRTPQGVYVGTLRGLFRQEGRGFQPVEGINQACWQLHWEEGSTLYASTADGLFAVDGNKAQRLTSHHTLSMYADGQGGFYTGEVDGLYYNKGNERRRHNPFEKATLLVKDADGTLWARNIFGQVFHWYFDSSDYDILKVKGRNGEDIIFNNTLFTHKQEIHQLNQAGIFVWDSEKKTMMPDTAHTLWSTDNQYPKFIYSDPDSRIWLTNNEGKNLRAYIDEQDTRTLNAEFHPLYRLSVQAMEVHEMEVWVGGHFGVIHRKPNKNQTLKAERQHELHVRQIIINGDSVVWGGFGAERSNLSQQPFDNLIFDSDTWRIRVAYSMNIPATVGMTEYRYQLNDDQMSKWSTETAVNLDNLPPGIYTLRMEARDSFGKEVAPVEIRFSILPPFYLRWYSLAAYVLLLAGGIYRFIRWRLQRLEKEKEELEGIVSKRTEEIIRQKDEIEEKSLCLEKTLEDLHAAQFQLIRQENMATVGALTKGLVDRILNPMNYINNFSHLSIGLVKDINENLEDDEEKMTPDNYEDCMDVLDMLKGNLQKIEEHGVNTTRILKAMEEILKDRTSHMAMGDLAAMCRKRIEVVSSYFAKDIEACHIRIEKPDEEVLAVAEVDMEQISKVVMNMLANSIYAVKKKYQQKPYEAVVSLQIEVKSEVDSVDIRIYDNGIGIEESILDKVFDPFFTTKTTAEAAGIGMYLSREYILNHHGELTVKSVKNEFTEFTISLPIRK